MPKPKVSILEVRRMADEAWSLAYDASGDFRHWGAALSEIATTQSWLKVLKRKIEAEQRKAEGKRKEAHDGN